MTVFSEHDGRTAIILVLSLVFLFTAGCTERERSGFSSIPQNSPAAWEITPYGDLRN